MVRVHGYTLMSASFVYSVFVRLFSLNLNCFVSKERRGYFKYLVEFLDEFRFSLPLQILWILIPSIDPITRQRGTSRFRFRNETIEMTNDDDNNDDDDDV